MKRQKLTSLLVVNGVLLLVVIIWSIPTLGLLVSSFRTAFRHSDHRLVENPSSQGVGNDRHL